jgi:hypothetical protein
MRLMISPSAFLKKWGRRGLVCFSKAALEDLSIPADAKSFLAKAGLPKSTAPFLTFESHGRHVPTVGEVYTGARTAAHFRMIGSDGADSPICLDEKRRGAVCLLEDALRPVLINSSVAQLAESLLVYRNFVDTVREEGGKTALMDGNLSAAAVADLERALVAVDRTARGARTFWGAEIRRLKQEAVTASLADDPGALRRALSHRDRKVRSAAAYEISQKGKEARAFIQDLKKALGDSDSDVRRLSIVALENCGKDAAVAIPEMVRLLDDSDPSTSSTAAEILGRFGTAARSALPGLRRLAKSANAWLRQVAGKSIRRLINRKK